MSRQAAIFWTLIVYKVVMLGIGLWAHGRSKNSDDYFLGGRGLGPWVAALSASASSSSVWTLIGVSGFAYLHGISALWILLGCTGGFVLNWYVVAPRLRRVSEAEGSITLSEVLAGPPGGPGRQTVLRLASLIVLACLLTYVAAQFAGAGKTFSETFDIGRASALLLGAGIIAAYTLLGGFWAVSLTDTLQGALMCVAALALPIAGMNAVGGGDALIDGLRLADPNYVDLFDGAGVGGGLGLAVGLLGIGLGYPGQPHVVNRLMALRDEQARVRGRRIAMGWALVVYTGMIVAGLCARVLLADLGDHENAFVALTQQLFSPVIAGIMIAAALSAIMSTADSQLLVAAAAVSHDLRLSGNDATVSDQARLLRSRVVVLVLCATAALIALLGNSEIFNSVLFAWSAMGAAFGPLLLVRLFFGRPRPGFAIAAMASGFCLAVGAHLLREDLGSAAGVVERVLPFAVAGVLAWWGRPRSLGSTRSDVLSP